MDVLTLVQRADSAGYDTLAKRLLAAADEPVCVTIISFEEQMRGWLAWITQARTLERQQVGYLRLHGLLKDFQTRPVLDFDERAITHFRSLAKLKPRPGTMDTKIAAIVLAHNALLISRNGTHFRQVPGLRVEVWTREEAELES
jgi:tRNA(fMet)-specific endonuclease VapC